MQMERSIRGKFVHVVYGVIPGHQGTRVLNHTAVLGVFDMSRLRYEAVSGKRQSWVPGSGHVAHDVRRVRIRWLPTTAARNARTVSGIWSLGSVQSPVKVCIKLDQCL